MKISKTYSGVLVTLFFCGIAQASNAPASYGAVQNQAPHLPQQEMSRAQREAQWAAEIEIKMEREEFEQKYRANVERERVRAYEAQREAMRAAQAKREADQEKREADEQMARIAERNKPENQLERLFQITQKKIRPNDSVSCYEKRHVSRRMAQEFLPMYAPAQGPAQQIMEDNAFVANNDMPCEWSSEESYYSTLDIAGLKELDNIDLTQAQWNAMRIKVARHYLDPQNGLFKSGDSSCGDRLCDWWKSKIFCSHLPATYIGKTCDMLSEHGTNSCDACIGCCCFLITCPIASAGTVVGAACDVATSPVSASYVCCGAECTRKCYRSRYERNVLAALGVHRKK